PAASLVTPERSWTGTAPKAREINTTASTPTRRSRREIVREEMQNVRPDGDIGDMYPIALPRRVSRGVDHRLVDGNVIHCLVSLGEILRDRTQRRLRIGISDNHVQAREGRRVRHRRDSEQ